MFDCKKIFSLLALLILFSCGKSDDEGPIEVETNGPISGEVNLFSSQGLATSFEDMTVSIEGTNFSINTNTQGAFNFPSVPFGNYRLMFEKTGFGTYYQTVEHDKGFSQNGTHLITLSLGKISNTAIYEAIPRLEGGDIQIRVVTNPVGRATSPVYVTVFFDSEVTVSNIENEGIRGPFIFNTGNTANILTITANQLSEMGFTSGDHVYFRAYGDSFHTNKYDGAMGTVHPNTRAPGSTTMSFVLP